MFLNADLLTIDDNSVYMASRHRRYNAFRNRLSIFTVFDGAGGHIILRVSATITPTHGSSMKTTDFISVVLGVRHYIVCTYYQIDNNRMHILHTCHIIKTIII